MKDQIYIIMNRKGAVAMRKTKPQLNSGEVAIKLGLKITDDFFDRFIPEAQFDIPESLVITPDVEVDVETPETEGEEKEVPPPQEFPTDKY